MALYHSTTKAISRGDGRSSTAAAAYRSADRIVDKRTGEIHDYSRRRGVEATGIMMPYGLDIDRSTLWNMAEGAERRKDAMVAREFELSLPWELDFEGRVELVREYADLLASRYGVAVDVALHSPGKKGDQRNFHAHVLATTRIMTKDGRLGEKSDMELSGTARKAKGIPSAKEQIIDLRKEWADMTNRALERAGSGERVTHLSLKDQGIDREPTIHMGPTATAMERRSQDLPKWSRKKMRADLKSERGDINRQIKQSNAERERLGNKIEYLRDAQASAEAYQVQLAEWARTGEERAEARREKLAAEYRERNAEQEAKREAEYVKLREKQEERARVEAAGQAATDERIKEMQAADALEANMAVWLAEYGHTAEAQANAEYNDLILSAEDMLEEIALGAAKPAPIAPEIQEQIDQRKSLAVPTPPQVEPAEEDKEKEFAERIRAGVEQALRQFDIWQSQKAEEKRQLELEQEREREKHIQREAELKAQEAQRREQERAERSHRHGPNGR
jgi:hypothetical protein